MDSMFFDYNRQKAAQSFFSYFVATPNWGN